MILRRLDDAIEPAEGRQHRAGADLRESWRELGCSLAGSDPRARNRENRSVIELFVDAHDRHAGLGFAMFDRALNGRSAAVFGKYRSVHIQKSSPRHVQKRGRKNFSVRHNHADVRLHRVDLLEHVTNLRGLRKRQSELTRFDGHGRRLQIQSAAGAFVGLRNDERDLVFARERFEHGKCEFGSAEENDAQAAGLYELSVVSCRLSRTDHR